MAAKRKVPLPKEKTAAPQLVTEVVEEELPVNEGVDVPDKALETIKEKAEEIEEVVEEIQADKPKEVLEEIFTKEPSPAVYPDITEHKRIGAAPVFLWAVIIIGVALLTGGTLLIVASGLPKIPALLVKPIPTPTPSPIPTPTPSQLQRSDIKVQVLNGGGTPGSAGKAKAFLEEKGYIVADVGNTDEYTYKKTEIHGKSGKEASLAYLKEDMSTVYTVATASADLASDSPYDAQVIVGKE